MKSRTLAALAIVVGMIVAPLAAGTAAYAEGDDGGTEIVAPPVDETAPPADEEVTPPEVVVPEPDAPEPEEVEPAVGEPEEVEPEVVPSEEAEPQGADKVWVCKYVGTPGVDERFDDRGKNPIDVAVSTLDGFDGTFPWEFADGQGRSVAIAYSDQDVTIDDCPTPQAPIEVRPTGWVFEDCGTEFDGLLLLATPGIVYSPQGSLVLFEGENYYEYLPDEAGEVIVTASAETGYVIVLGDPTEWVTNDDGSVTATVYFTDEPCPVPTPTPTPTPAATPTAVVLAATGGGDTGPLLPLGAFGLIALGTLAVFGRKLVAARK